MTTWHMAADMKSGAKRSPVCGHSRVGCIDGEDDGVMVGRGVVGLGVGARVGTGVLGVRVGCWVVGVTVGADVTGRGVGVHVGTDVTGAMVVVAECSHRCPVYPSGHTQALGRTLSSSNLPRPLLPDVSNSGVVLCRRLFEASNQSYPES